MEPGLSDSHARRPDRYYVLAVAFFLVGFVCVGTMSNLAVFCIDLGYAEQSGTVLSALWVAAAALSLVSIRGRMTAEFRESKFGPQSF